MIFKNPFFKKIASVIFWTALFLVFISPIFLYIYTFGWHITNDHQRWGEMGSAFSGIYTPLLSILTLVVLVVQIRIQSSQATYEHDRAYISEARADVEYYLNLLNYELDKTVKDQVTVRQFLLEAFAYVEDIDTLKAAERLKIAQEFNRKLPLVSGIWGAFYPLLQGLGANVHYPYEHNFSAAKQKAIATTSFALCVALDNYYWCLSEGRVNFHYQYSPLLAKN
ncbi:MAG TPA: hypothetical protein DCG63_12660 [Methylophilaceae bacterium]|nr:hypothetical protein [Methylophilaceae bacterium]